MITDDMHIDLDDAGDIIISRLPSRETRQEWAETNAEQIATLLRSPSLTDARSRLWRLRYWQDGDYLIATMMQNLESHAVSIYLIRPYHHVVGLVGATGRSTVQLDLSGQYSAHEIVAFLRLDLCEPADVVWHYETPKPQIVTPVQQIVSGAIGASSTGGRY